MNVPLMMAKKQRYTTLLVTSKKNTNMKAAAKTWSNSLKRKARKKLLEIYNCYEPKKVKYVKNVIFYPDGRASKIGFAHDYSFWAW